MGITKNNKRLIFYKEHEIKELKKAIEGDQVKLLQRNTEDEKRK